MGHVEWKGILNLALECDKSPKCYQVNTGWVRFEPIHDLGRLVCKAVGTGITVQRMANIVHYKWVNVLGHPV